MAVFGGPELERVVQHPLYGIGPYSVERSEKEYVEIYVSNVLALVPVHKLSLKAQVELVATTAYEGAEEFELIWNQNSFKYYREKETEK